MSKRGIEAIKVVSRVTFQTRASKETPMRWSGALVVKHPRDCQPTIARIWVGATDESTNPEEGRHHEQEPHYLGSHRDHFLGISGIAER